MKRKKIVTQQIPVMRHIKTAVLYDDLGSMGTTVEQQIASDIRHVTELGCDEKVVLDWYRAYTVGDITPGTELVLFDFGGVSMGYGGGDLMADQSRAMIRWALDNPNSLMLVTSGFTYERAVE